LHPVWRLPSELVLLLILAELLASAEGERVAPRSSPRPRSAPPPKRVARRGRSSLSGRRPRG
jgi:hypothetical protein